MFDDALARRNALVLALAAGLAGANASVVIATGSLVGQALAPSPGWATAPVTTFVIGSALATIPAAEIMRRLGRRTGYCIGAGLGVAAGLVGAYAVREGAFAIFMFATALCGMYQAFVLSYRFGATDNASPSLQPRLISWVTLGGLAAAFVGPQLVIHTKDMTPPFMFMASYLGQAAFAGLAILVLSFVRNVPKPVAAGAQEAPRPLAEIFRSRRLRVAVACGAVAQALMNLIMTATPLAMVGCAHSTTDAALAIQWHIVGMFLPGLVTGKLINRFGVYPVIVTGLGLLAGCGIVALAGISVEHFFAALILLGVGWNFAFVGASSLLVGNLRPAERTKVQGFNDFVVFTLTSLASLSAGAVLANFGWGPLNLMIFPFVLAAGILVFRLSRAEKRVLEAAE